jgi:hypothetical protein
VTLLWDIISSLCTVEVLSLAIFVLQNVSYAREREASGIGWPRNIESTACPGTVMNAYKTFVTNTEKNRLLKEPWEVVGRYSSVGIATRHGLDGPGIESRLGRDFPAPVQTGTGAPPGLLYIRYRVSFPGVKRPGRGVDHPPPN